MTLDEYCGVIADWLMANPKALTVLEYFENNEELFPLSEVLAANDSRIYDVLSERILQLGLQNKVNASIAKLYLSKRFESENTIKTDSVSEIKFKFG